MFSFRRIRVVRSKRLYEWNIFVLIAAIVKDFSVFKITNEVQLYDISEKINAKEKLVQFCSTRASIRVPRYDYVLFIRHKCLKSIAFLYITWKNTIRYHFIF
jgi:hypothetical protein